MPRMHKTVHVHINTIRPGDTIDYYGHLVTVCAKDIKHSELMGTTLFGESYRCGQVMVRKQILVEVK